MRQKNWLHATIVWSTCIAMVMPTGIATAAEPSKAIVGSLFSVKDVVLSANGSLAGRIVDSAGAPLVGKSIVLSRNAKALKQTSTRDGRFECAVPSGGTYQVIVDGQVSLVRAWTAGAAPPNAQKEILIVVGDVVRGQQYPCSALTNPWIVAGLLGAAIAIPVAIHNHRADRSAGS